MRRTSDGEVYALKKVKINELSEKEKTNALNEIRILASIKHPNIISYKESFIEDNLLWYLKELKDYSLIMEYAKDGDLYAEIVRHQQRASYPDEEWVWKVFIQILRGLKALHQLRILHRDLKSANIFLSDDK